jgi:hypothetical protein
MPSFADNLFKLAQDNICVGSSDDYDMKKQELIHIHGLLVEIQSHYEMESGCSTDYPEYERLGVNPTSIHRSKTAHEEAIFAFLDGLTDAMTSKEAQMTSHAD